MAGQAPYPRRWWALVVLCLCVLVIAFDTTILNVALPTLVRQLSATASEQQWMVDAYSMVFAGLLLTAGSVGDRFGRKRLLLLGLTVFAGFSLLAAFSGSALQLILVRGFMGAGATLIMPAALGTLIALFSREERARAIAVLTTMTGLGMPVGPVLGGWLIDRFSWHAVFLINLPVAALAVAGTLWLVPDSRSPGVRRLDFVGAALSTGGLAGLLYAIIEGPGTGWTAPSILAALALAAVLLGCFVVWEMRTPQPMLPLSLFADPRFSVPSVAITLVFFAMMGGLFFLTQYLQFVLGFSPLQAGLRVVPLTAGLAIGAPLGAALVKHVQARYSISAGLLVGAGGLAILITCTTTSGYAPVLLSLLVLGFGIGCAATPAADMMLGAVPEERFGIGSAVNDTTQEVGGALGVAVLGSVLAASYGTGMAAAARHLPPPLASAARNSIGGAIDVARQLPPGPAAALVHAARQAFVHAMAEAAVFGLAIALCGTVVALLFLPGKEETVQTALPAEPTEAVSV